MSRRLVPIMFLVFLCGFPLFCGAQEVNSANIECAKQLLLPLLLKKHPDPLAAKWKLDNCLYVTTMEAKGLGKLAQNILLVEYCSPRPSDFFYMMKVGDECLLLGGDINTYLPDYATFDMQRDLLFGNFNKMVVNTPSTDRTTEEIVYYVLALLKILYVHPEYGLRIIRSANDIWADTPVHKQPKKRRLSTEDAAKITPPQVVPFLGDSYRGSFYAWSNVGGWVEKVSFTYWRDGRVLLDETVLAKRVGPYSMEYVGRM